MAGICRVKGNGQTGKDPLSPELPLKMFRRRAQDLRSHRDHALLCWLSLPGAFRRSEVVALLYEEVSSATKVWW